MILVEIVKVFLCCRFFVYVGGGVCYWGWVDGFLILIRGVLL